MKHFGRWIAAGIAAVFAASLLGTWRLGSEVVGRIWLVVGVVGVLAYVPVVARMQGTRPSVVTMVLSAAGSGLAGWVWSVSAWSWWRCALFTALVVTPLMSGANASFRADIRRGQRLRDRAAAGMVERLRSGGSARFALYLRPFATTERLAAQPLPSEVGGGNGLPSHLDIETLLSRALRGTCPVVALGRPGEVLEGAARIETTDAGWRSTMTVLAQHAELIVMTPLARPSTLWELGWLAEHGLLGKIVMVMPEVVSPTPSEVVFTTSRGGRLFDAGTSAWDPEPHTIDLAAEWARAVAAAGELGVRLPPLAAVGALFTLDPARGTVARIVPLALSTSARRVRYLREVLPALRGAAGPDVPNLLTRATAHRGATLEYALVRAADGFLLWSSPAAAAQLLERAVRESTPPQFVEGYLNHVPALVQERRDLGDDRAVEAYLTGVRALLRHGGLATLAPRGLAERLAADPPDGTAPVEPHGGGPG